MIKFSLRYNISSRAYVDIWEVRRMAIDDYDRATLKRRIDIIKYKM